MDNANEIKEEACDDYLELPSSPDPVSVQEDVGLYVKPQTWTTGLRHRARFC